MSRARLRVLIGISAVFAIAVALALATGCASITGD